MQQILNNMFVYQFGNPRLENTIPPSKAPPKVCFGSYCMRATVDKFDKNDDIISTFKGYSNDMDITVDVEEACEMRRREGEKCGPSKLCFLRDIPTCNGMIAEYNGRDELVNIIRLKK